VLVLGVGADEIVGTEYGSSKRKIFTHGHGVLNLGSERLRLEDAGEQKIWSLR
jgi:hypothetical protein